MKITEEQKFDNLMRDYKELQKISKSLTKEKKQAYLVEVRRMYKLSVFLGNQFEILYTYIELLRRFIPLKDIINTVIDEIGPGHGAMVIIFLAAYDPDEELYFLDLGPLVYSGFKDFPYITYQSKVRFIQAFDHWNRKPIFDQLDRLIRLADKWDDKTIMEYDTIRNDVLGRNTEKLISIPLEKQEIV